MNKRHIWLTVIILLATLGLVNCNLVVSMFEDFTDDSSTKPAPTPGPSAEPGDIHFYYTGGIQSFTVPAGITSISVECQGAQGYSTPVYPGGYGAYAFAEVAVSPGARVYIYVGGQGQPAFDDGTGGPVVYNGGGAGFSCDTGIYAGGGGGATDIRIGGQSLNDRVIVAGGGGGAVEMPGGIGGNGGAADSGYGLLGVGCSAAGPSGYSGGGGGGWYGGTAGGENMPGTGGSSYTGGQGSFVTTNQYDEEGSNSGDGHVMISWGDYGMLLE
ncbi:MAG: hypothetical protein JW881_01075 [Spirochaetales bacterium]|nr:hypothetical protein [Spirochaetales bacterium]